MAVIDADAHVVESERTWDFMEGQDQKYRPTTVLVPGPDGKETESWHIDGRLISKGPIAVDEVTRALREMEDIPARLRHMDELGTDIQVLFPTIFLGPVTNRPGVEIALYRGYNRWLADIWKQGQGRLRWAVAVPTVSMDVALEELRFGEEHGACGVFMRGMEVDKLPSDPYFFPLYQAASDLNLPICIHAAASNFVVHDLFPNDPGIWRFKVPGINAFHTLIMNATPDRFPSLRFGFIELSAQWVPYVIHDAVRRLEKRGKMLDRKAIVQAYRTYVACQTDDDIPYVLSYTGEHNMVMGTDYGHADTSSELEALQRLKEMPGLSQDVVHKILDDNARALYRL